MSTHSTTDDLLTRAMWTRLYVIIYLIYIAIGLAWRFLLTPVHGDAIVYVHAARSVLDGSFDMYSLRVIPESAPPLGGGYSYSPLTALIMAPFVALAQALGWGEEGVQRSIAIPLLFIDVLAMHQLRKLARAWRPGVDERFLFLGILLTLFLTGLWIASAARGHHEGLILLFLFLTLRVTPRNILLGGVYAGLTLAAKQPALLALLPIGMALLAGGSAGAAQAGEGGNQDNRWRGPHIDAVKWGGVAFLVFAGILLPAVVSSPDNAYYMLVTQESRRTFIGTGLPVRLDEGLKATLSSDHYASARAALIQHSNTVLVGVVALVTGLTIWWARRKGRRITLMDSRLLALVAFGAVCQIVLGKWVGSHYYPVPLALVFIWDVVRTAPASQGETRGWGLVGAFPWIGLGAAIAFRSITQIQPVWLKDWLILALFIALAVSLLLGLRAKYAPAKDDAESH